MVEKSYTYEPKEYFRKLDGLRGFLTLFVLCFHFNIPYSFTGSFEWVSKAFAQGGVAPQMFFMISGFLLMNAYKESHEHTAMYKFYLKRSFRIFPLYWLVLFLTFTFWVPNYEGSILKNMFFLFGLKPYTFQELIVPVAWTLFVEETYYLITPFIAKKINIRSALICFLIFLQTYYLFDHIFPGSHSGETRWENPLNTFHYFFAGVAIYLIYKKDKIGSLKMNTADSIGLDLMTISLFTALLCQFPIDNVVLGVFLIITALSERSLVGKLIWNNPILVWAGSRCYSIYLTHILVMNLLNKKLKEYFTFENTNADNFLLFASTTILVFIFSELAYRLVERPFILLGKRVLA